MKNVQIPYELFHALFDYHLNDSRACEDMIRQGLLEKRAAMIRHELYSLSKTAESEDARELARKMYLDSINMHEDFRC